MENADSAISLRFDFLYFLIRDDDMLPLGIFVALDDLGGLNLAPVSSRTFF